MFTLALVVLVPALSFLLTVILLVSSGQSYADTGWKAENSRSFSIWAFCAGISLLNCTLPWSSELSSCF